MFLIKLLILSVFQIAWKFYLMKLIKKTQKMLFALLAMTRSFDVSGHPQKIFFKLCSRLAFFGLLSDGGGKRWLNSPLITKICYTYPAMMKLNTVIPYLKKIQKIYKLQDTLLEFCWYQYFFTRQKLHFNTFQSVTLLWIKLYCRYGHVTTLTFLWDNL